MSYGRREEAWEKPVLAICVAIAAVAIGFAIYLIIISLGTAFGLAVDIARRGATEVVSPGSWAFSAVRFAAWFGPWVLISCGIAVGVNVTVHAVDKGAEVVKDKPAITLAVALGAVANLLADLCFVSLPTAGQVEKSLFKFGSAILFAVAGWLFASKGRNHRLAGLVLWVALPLAMLLLVYFTSKIGVGVWVYVGAWIILATVTALLARRFTAYS